MSRPTIRDSIMLAQLLIRLTYVNRPADLYTDYAILVSTPLSSTVSVLSTGAALHENKEATAKSTSQDGGMAVNFG